MLTIRKGLTFEMDFPSSFLPHQVRHSATACIARLMDINHSSPFLQRPPTTEEEEDDDDGDDAIAISS